MWIALLCWLALLYLLRGKPGSFGCLLVLLVVCLLLAGCG
jgi:hypothetical protein